MPPAVDNPETLSAPVPACAVNNTAAEVSYKVVSTPADVVSIVLVTTGGKSVSPVLISVIFVIGLGKKSQPEVLSSSPPFVTWFVPRDTSSKVKETVFSR